MDKNTLTGFILIAAVLIGFSYFSRPSEAEMEAQRRQDSIATVAQQKAQMAQEAKEEAEIAHQTRRHCFTPTGKEKHKTSYWKTS